MPFYKINLGDYPEDVEFRSLSTHPVFGQGKEVIETKTKLTGLTEMTADERQPLGDLTHCVATFETRKAATDDIPAYEAALAAAAEQYLKPATREVMKPAVEATVATVKADTGVKDEPIGGEVGRG